MNDGDVEEWVSRFSGGLQDVLGRLDVHTSSHCRRVCRLTIAFGRDLGLRGEELMILGVAAGLHDVGKIVVPHAILHKVGSLSEAEWETMQTHSIHGERLIRRLRDLPCTDDIALAVRHHHENHDGSGYPDNLREQAIPLPSRVLAVADSYDAIRNRRSYHACRSHAATTAILAAERGSKHDPQILDAFLSRDKSWFDQLVRIDK